MLLELKVSNFAIIDQIHMQFENGFNVISGETGAGKSILIKSLSLLMGAKAKSDVIRKGAPEAVIEGSFDISDRQDILDELQSLGIATDEDLLVVRRVLTQQGKSRVYINNSIATLASLRDLISPLVEVTGRSAPLIEMTGQHDNKNLMSKSYHIDILDNYAGTTKIRNQYLELFELRKEIESQIELLRNDDSDRDSKLDYLNFQKNEIESLEYTAGEEDELIERIKRLKGSHRILDFLNFSQATISDDGDSILYRLDKIIQKSSEIEKFDRDLAELVEPLQQIRLQLEDVGYELQRYGSNYQDDSEDLDGLEDRLSRIRVLQKKLTGSADSISEHYENICGEIDVLENREAKIAELQSELQAIEVKMQNLAKSLRKRRIEGAKLLSSGINDELLDLNMKGLRFAVRILPVDKFLPTGMDDVEFQTKTSQKDDFKPLAKFASGGELSRILLSLKNVASDASTPRTYLFDEVDTGVSGETAQKVGHKLKNIAQGQQVICVTHLPQVAAFSDHHFYIEKQTVEDRAVMNVKTLEDDTKVNEIARLLSGERITKASVAHAKELLSEI